MAISASELREWCFHLKNDTQICIDDGGLIVQVVGNPDIYIEVGGDPEYDD